MQTFDNFINKRNLLGWREEIKKKKLEHISEKQNR